MYKLKQIPQDFIVEEISELNLGSGDYSTYRLKKIGYNTVDAVKTLSDILKINPKFFNYAGTKDRQAVTTQYITISKGPKKNLELNDLSLEYLGDRKERLNLGDLDENKFIITIRNIDSKPSPIESMPNYFDSQRFGKHANNHIIGKLILKGEFKEAENLLGVSNIFDYFQKIPKQLSRMYIHAYQSYLFNKMVSLEIQKQDHIIFSEPFNDLAFTNNKLVNKKIPLIGFGTEYNDAEEFLEKEGLTLRDFIVRKIPHLSSEGDERDMVAKVKGLVICELEVDELNENKKKCQVYFTLPKGSYATNVIRAIFSNKD